MNKQHCADTNRIVTHRGCGEVSYNNLKIKPIVDSRSIFDRELDGMFRKIGFAAVPLITAVVLSAGFCSVMLVAVACKWFVTGSIF